MYFTLVANIAHKLSLVNSDISCYTGGKYLQGQGVAVSATDDDRDAAVAIVPTALYTPEMAAAVLHSSLSKVYRKIRDKTLPATQYGREYRILGSDLLDYFKRYGPEQE